MSLFEDSQYRWRETYFVLFDSSNRPTLKAVRRALSELNEHYVLRNLSADEEGRFDSLTLLSPDDFAALDICYTGGEEVLDHAASLLKEMGPVAREMSETAALRRILRCDGRFDVLHFEQVPDYEYEEEGREDSSDEMLDPSALLLVLGALARLTNGVSIDPQAGTFLDGGQ
jgi:hypothetical protein